MIERGILKEEELLLSLCASLYWIDVYPSVHLFFSPWLLFCWALNKPDRCDLSWIKYGYPIMSFLRWGQEGDSHISLRASESKQGQCELALIHVMKLSLTDCHLICPKFWICASLWALFSFLDLSQSLSISHKYFILFKLNLKNRNRIENSATGIEWAKG